MKEIKLVDQSFSGYTNPFYQSQDMVWKRVKHEQVTTEDLVVYTNLQLRKGLDYPVRSRVGILLESRGISWSSYEFIEDNLDAFDHVITCDDSIVDLDPERCVYVPRGGCWIRREDLEVYEKTRFISFISSKKSFDAWSAVGHGFRTDLYQVLTRIGGCLGARLERAGLKKRIDIYGRITGNPIPYKLDSLKDYMFQIAVENMVHDTYFTEKLIDCFATGTIPIFRGTRKVDRYFDPRGIIFFDTLEELTDLLIDLSEDDYYDRLDAVRENFDRAKDFLLMEDWLCKKTDFLSW